ncbi:hypothetical protein E0H22_14685 [Rhodopseudomonas boonkerdii]|uniref:alginate export family protein n=1 Tax=Rhodopseudomonas boonkerdii TaxID=475937 RepID=UPI001E55E84C|nr:alginate export family protein [Rhodopseudomonas boonkerdii]UGV26818.1 hypothetical protein E0H22_14685 [Rhodopseudomonas boonkerdii]
MIKFSFVLAATIAATTTFVRAQVGTDVERAPTLTNERYVEDWSYLADPSRRTGHWTEPFKYIPLDEHGLVYLTTGMEARSRYEGYTNVNWGSAPNDSYIWHRFMPYADLHAGKVRLFTQPIFSEITGTDRPVRPVDTTGADMLQAFGEIEMDVGDRTALRMSAGRKLMSLGAGRFIDTRYGPNVPQAFDGLDAVVTSADRQVTVLYARPIDNFPGDFDDRPSRQKSVWGAYATEWLRENRSIGVDVYYLGLLDRDAIFDQGCGRERAHTFGTRIFGDTGTWFWNVEGALQRGSFGTHRVAAWGIGGEFGYRFLQTWLQPEVRFMSDVISGDNNPDDPNLETFNPLFPRGKYFGALSPVGPRNLIQVRPSISVHPRRDVAVSLTGGAFWRQSAADGIYGVPGNLVRSGKGSDARFIGHQVELSVAWQATAELNLSASLSTFEPGRFISDTGPSQTITLISLMANFRF